MHEGLDIHSLQHDRHGEPTDPVMATADGTVMYVNTKPGLSNYGKYIVIRHVIDGLEIYSLYAHLSETSVTTGQAVRAGTVIATMGRTSNTSERIGKERAHVHFELNLLINDNYATWFKKNSTPGERNDHGNWNGKNLGGPRSARNPARRTRCKIQPAELRPQPDGIVPCGRAFDQFFRI